MGILPEFVQEFLEGCDHDGPCRAEYGCTCCRSDENERLANTYTNVRHYQTSWSIILKGASRFTGDYVEDSGFRRCGYRVQFGIYMRVLLERCYIFIHFQNCICAQSCSQKGKGRVNGAPESQSLCENRIAQMPRQIPLEIYKTANKGWG